MPGVGRRQVHDGPAVVSVAIKVADVDEALIKVVVQSRAAGSFLCLCLCLLTCLLACLCLCLRACLRMARTCRCEGAKLCLAS